VDDDDLVRTLLVYVLEQRGFEVRSAPNGREGLALAREWLPDVIVTDLMMPVMDGFQAAEALQADPHTRPIPIVALSSMSTEKVQARAEKIGKNTVISISIPLHDLLKTIEAHLPSSE
jgi:CheY-like chemotaxis protein